LASGGCAQEAAAAARPARTPAAASWGAGLRGAAGTGESALGSSADRGELAKLGFRGSPTTIRRLLAGAGLDPALWYSGPGWREFLRAREASIVACDFFTVESLLLRRHCVLFFIAHASRRVWLAGRSTNPTGAWVTQQARNFGLDLAD